MKEPNLEKAQHEKIIGEAWFNGVYNEEQAKIISEFQGLSWEMVQWWYGKNYHEMEAASCGSN